MSEEKHTNGPWSIRDDFLWGAAGIYAPDERIGKPFFPTDLATVRADCDTGKANARLIAAAPELMEALKDCREALRRAEAEGELKVVDAAISKAQGCGMSDIAARRAFIEAAQKLVKEHCCYENIKATLDTLEALIAEMLNQPVLLIMVEQGDLTAIKEKAGIEL